MRGVSRIIRLSVVIVIAIALTGCAKKIFMPAPGVSLDAFEPAKAECSIMARHGGTGLVAGGSVGFVAGAAVGNAVGNAIQANQDFNDCMTLHGFRMVEH